MNMENVPKKILIIDDEQDLREAIATTLSYEGFEIISAGDGEEGLKLALSEKPDLIFLDIIMPKLDGLSMLKKLREDEWGKDVKVVVMTVLDDMGKMAEAVQEGATEYIVKTTITLSSLAAKAREYLNSEQKTEKEE